MLNNVKILLMDVYKLQPINDLELKLEHAF